jgi:hypothetical protein
MKLANGGDFEEIAVMVGDFPRFDDRAAEATLEKIKAMQPKALAMTETTPSSQVMGQLRALYRRVKNDPEDSRRGPMGQAFLIPNPLLPEEYFRQQQVDTAILDLNRGIQYSLLECPAPYSVRVATFRGEVTFDLKTIELAQYEDSKLKARDKSALAEAGEKARRLTEELRKAKIGAYVFHDRYESYVCVGAFDWVTRTGSDGKEVWNPAVIETINRYKGSTVQGQLRGFPGMANLVQPKSMAALRGTDIVFDIQPIAVRIPTGGTGRR